MNLSSNCSPRRFCYTFRPGCVRLTGKLWSSIGPLLSDAPFDTPSACLAFTALPKVLHRLMP